MVRRLHSFLLAAVLGVAGAAPAATNDDPPDSQINTVSGTIETADTPWAETNYGVRHVINLGGGRDPLITTLATDERDDVGARLLINSVNGDSWVAWWRDAAVDQVVVRKRINATGEWTAERAQSVTSVGCRRPSLAFHGGQAWIAYEADAAGGGTVLEAKVIEDDPAPFVTGTAVASTTYTGTKDAAIQTESGRLWLSWIDGATQVGWSRYDSGTGFWSAPAFESYAADSVAAARERIRSAVLQN